MIVRARITKRWREGERERERRRSMAGGEQRWQRQCEPRRTAASNDMAVRAVDCLRTSTTCRKPLGDGLLERELPHWTHTLSGTE